ncbi:MAG: hypothetical protein M0Z88_07895 [Actinomycetota bacterium]|nr:hypothetical protein [Actinomycetota bacterium]
MSSEVLTDEKSAAPPQPRKFTIVPIPGIVGAGAYAVALVVALISNTNWAVDFFHVVSGALWTGIDLFVGFVIGPIIGRMSIPSRMEFSTRFMPKMVVIMPALVVGTLAAGFQLARQEGYILSSWPDHGWVVASFIVVGVLAVVAIGVLEPANLAVLFELRKPQPDGELVGRLMKRFIYTAGITGAMQVATLVIMTRLATA